MKYRDNDNVKKDIQTLNEILYRQGASILLDVIAEKLGQDNLDYQWSENEATRIRDAFVSEFKDAINERV